MTKATAAPDKRIGPVLAALHAEYPDADCELRFRNALELLAATILSAQCTDVRVNKVTEELFREYKTADDYADAKPGVLEEEIRSTGFFNNKAKALRGMGAALRDRFGGEVPRTMDELLTVPGAARKTANVVLGTAYGIPSGVVVDTHVLRLSARLGLTAETTAVKVERDLMALVPKDEWIFFGHAIIWHGRRVCSAKKPACEGCVLERLCPSAGKA